MSRKFKVIAGILVAVVLMTAGTVSVAAAQEEPAEQPEVATGVVEAPESLLARVAEILGKTEEEVAAAFQQAREECLEEGGEDCGQIGRGLRAAIGNRLLPMFGAPDEVKEKVLDRAIERGLITPDQADNITGRLESRIRERLEDREEHLETLLERLAESGRLGPDEVEEIREWWQGRPEAVDELMSGLWMHRNTQAGNGPQLKSRPHVRGNRMNIVPGGRGPMRFRAGD